LEHTSPMKVKGGFGFGYLTHCTNCGCMLHVTLICDIFLYGVNATKCKAISLLLSAF